MSEDNENYNEFVKRKEEIELSLFTMKELMDSRNHLLGCFEKSVLNKTINRVFSNLNRPGLKGTHKGIVMVKQTIEMDIRMIRRTLFYISKRRRYLLEELELLEEKINQLQVGSTNPSPSSETPQESEETSPPHSEST